jgi:hypothetical protein
MIYNVVMKDFKEWLSDKIETVKESSEKEPIKGGRLIRHKKKKSHVRDLQGDLSNDYKNPASSFGTVWPFKVLTGRNATVK